MTSGTERRSTAYHEAGPAVMAYRLGRGAHKVSIVEDEESLGRVTMMKLTGFQPDIEHDSKTRWRIEQSIRISLAGPLAEAKITGRYNRVGASADHQSAGDLALNWCGSSESASAFLNWLSIETKEALDLRFVWDGVQALAAELLENSELSWRKARTVIREGMYRELLERSNQETPPKKMIR